MERRYLQPDVRVEPIAVEQREDGTAVVRGYAAVYYRSDDPGTQFQVSEDVSERILPGAFDRALAERDDARALFNHDPSFVLGRVSAGTLRLSTNRRGLQYEIDTPDTSYARDLVASLARGDVTGSSFAFQVEDQAFRKDGQRDVREIRSVRLFDVGPVTFPAYKSTSAGLRSEDVAECLAAYDAWLDGETQDELESETPWRLNLAKAKLRLAELED